MEETITLQEAISRLNIHALLDDDQETSKALLAVVRMHLGQVCPNCGHEDRTMFESNNDGEHLCYKCEEIYDAGEHALDMYENVLYEYQERKAAKAAKKLRVARTVTKGRR